MTMSSCAVVVSLIICNFPVRHDDVQLCSEVTRGLKINQMAAEGLDPTLKMLKIIQDFQGMIGEENDMNLIDQFVILQFVFSRKLAVS